MNPPEPESNPSSRIDAEASDWAARIDRGLTAAEQDRYTEWLAADPSHRDAMKLSQWAWDEFDRLAGIQASRLARPDADLLAPGNRFARRPLPYRKLFAFPVAMAAACLAAFFWIESRVPPDPEPDPISTDFLARIEKRSLDDGSEIQINRGAVVQADYSPRQRGVTLLKGEASFKVAKDPSRPFVVNAAGVLVKAVGTEFNVRLSEGTLDVIVTEGRVSLLRSPEPGGSPAQETFLDIGQKAFVALDQTGSRFVVTDLAAAELDERTSWQPRLLDFDSAPLGQIVAAFNRSNPVKVTLGQPKLESLELSCAFWSDNTEGFVRLMESSFGMQAEWRSPKEIVLR